jgi:phage-related protein
VPIYNAGSASVKIVPDFSGAQKDIGDWFARQGDLKVKIKPEIDDASLIAAKAKTDAVMHGEKIPLEVDEEHLARSIGKAIEEAIRSLSTVDVLNEAVKGAIAPSMISVIVGGLTELAASTSQLLGVLGLVPAGILGLSAPLATVLVGITGVTKAFGVFNAKTPAQMKAAQQALDKLAPSARQFVEQVHQLAPAFTSLKLDVQQQLFNGLGTAVLHLGQVALPVMKAGMAGIATSINQGLLASIQKLQNSGPAFTAIWANINAAIGPLVKDILPILVQDFVQVAQIGSTFLPQLSQALVVLTQKFDGWLQKMMQTGQLTQDIKNAIGVIDSLARIVGNLGNGISAIFSAAIPYGNQLLNVVGNMTGQFAAFLHTADAQGSLKAFFLDVNRVAETLLPVLLQLAQVLVANVLPVIGDLAAAIAPVIAELGSQLAEVIAAITQMLPPLAQVIASLISGMAPLIPVLGQIIETLLPPLLVVGKQLGPVIDQLARIVAGILLEAVKALAPALTDLGTAFLQILQSIWPIIVPLGQIVTSLLPPLLSIVEALLPPISLLIADFARLGTTLLSSVQPVVRGLAEFLSGVLVPVLHFIGPALTPIVEALLAWQAAAFGLKLVMEAIKFAQWIAFVVQYAIQVNLVAAATKAWTIAQAAWAVVTNIGAYATMAAGLAKYLVTVDLVSAATKAWALVQTILDAALSPVILVILAVVAAAAALAFGIYELATHWSAVWGAIKSVALDVWHALQSAWNTFVSALTSAFSTVWNDVLHPIFTGIMAAWNAVATAFEVAWNNVLHPIWNVIAGAAIVLYRIVVVIVLGEIKVAWWLMVHAAELAWNTVLKPTWDALKTAALFMWNDVLKPTWSAIQTAWRALGDAIKWVNDNIIQPVWDAIKTAALWLWNNLLKPTWAGMQAGWSALGTGLKWVNDNIIQPVWDALKAAVSFLWNSVLKPIWDAIKTAWNDLGAAFQWVEQNVFQKVWNAITSAVQSVQRAFEAVVAGIKSAWTTLEGIVATPINFVIKKVFDDGLFTAWNWVVDHLGLPGSWHAPSWSQLPVGTQFDKGGYTGAGIFGTGGKKDPAGVVHAGEFVFDQEKTQRFLPLFQAIHSGMAGYDGGGFVSPSAGVLAALANPLDPAGLVAAIGQMLGGYANGSGAAGHGMGPSQFLTMLSDIPGTLFRGMWDAVKGAILSAAGKVGGFFSNGTSMPNVPSSRAANEAIVRSAAAAYGWDQGAMWSDLVSVIMRESGFNNNAQNPHSSAYGMFQFLDTTWNEFGIKTADPTNQAKYGMRYIAERYNNPANAYAHEMNYGWYDQGGYLPPGYSTVFNGTGSPEVVLTAAQNDALQHLASMGALQVRQGLQPTVVAGMVNNGTVYTYDNADLARKQAQGTRKALAGAGLPMGGLR